MYEWECLGMSRGGDEEEEGCCCMMVSSPLTEALTKGQTDGGGGGVGRQDCVKICLGFFPANELFWLVEKWCDMNSVKSQGEPYHNQIQSHEGKLDSAKWLVSQNNTELWHEYEGNQTCGKQISLWGIVRVSRHRFHQHRTIKSNCQVQ